MLSLPSNVTCNVVGNAVTINFTKGTDSVRTEIDKYWVGAAGSYDEYTTGDAFYYENLSWGTHYEFKLRAFSSGGEMLESEVYSFDIEAAIIPTAPTGIVITIDEAKHNDVTINFTKGAGVKTEIDKMWVGEAGSWDEYTTGQGFMLKDLAWGTHYQFKLRSVSNTGAVAETAVISFDVEAAIVPTLPTNVSIVIDEVYRNCVTVSFTKGAGIKTEIDKLWVGAAGSYDEYTVGNGFVFNNLPWGTHYEFKLRSVSNTGEAIESGVYSFDIEAAIVPTAPTNVTVTVDEAKHNNVTISFTKGAGIKTEIDKSWIGAVGTYDDYTGGGAFLLENLEWGKHYEFKLRSVSNTLEVAETEVFSFDIEPAIVPTAPTNIQVSVDPQAKNNVTVTFTKGAGVKTEIDKFWVNGQGTYDEYTTGNAFYFENLPWGTHYEFKLKSVSNTGEAVESGIIAFDVIPMVIPSLPSSVNVEVQLRTALIRFNKGANAEVTALDIVNIGSGYDSQTAGNAFYFENLSFGTTYQFKLKSISPSGHYVESGLYSFQIEPLIVPTAPKDIKVEFDKEQRNAVVVRFTKGQAYKTEIDKFWVNGQNTWDEASTGSAFDLKTLDWGVTYQFRLRNCSNDVSLPPVLSDIVTFKVDDPIIPTAPTNVSILPDAEKQNTVTINFVKGNGIKTAIDFLDPADNALDTYTVDKNKFYFENLPWGRTFRFVLKSISNTGAVATSQEYQFTTPQALPPTLPTNVKVIIDEQKRNQVTITFTKGTGVKTQIDKMWVKNRVAFDEYTTGQAFSYQNLPWGQTYEFMLRTVGVTGDSIVSNVYSFTIEPEILPTAPSGVEIKLFKNNAEVRFAKGQGIRTEMDKMWVGAAGSWDEYTAGEIFYLPNLPWGNKYDFKLRSAGNTGVYAETPVYTIDVPAEIIPTAPTNVEVTLEHNTAYVKFTKGVGICTKMDKFWVNGQGSWDEETTDSGFVLDNLNFDTQYQFILGSFSNTDAVAQTSVISFTTPKLVVPTAPTNVACAVEANTVTIKFTKGASLKTEIDKFWVGGQGTWDEYTTDDGFYLTGLEFETKYQFRLRSVGDNGAVSETPVHSFEVGSKDVPVLTGPVLPPTTKINNYESEFEERWFYSTKEDGTPPGVTAETIGRLRKYNGFYLGDASKKEVFLTFDEGYETGQTARILDTLKANDVKAAFFITGMYLNGQLGLVKRMAEEGHLVCNHSTSHPSTPNKARESRAAFEKELVTLANSYTALTGKEIAPYFRPPMGKFSELSLKYANDIGYNTTFWSFAYADWNPNNQPDPNWAKDYVVNHVHNGAIILLHAVSKTNADILDYVIKSLKAKGFTFNTLNNLPRY